jgi:hypothetical protein
MKLLAIDLGYSSVKVAYHNETGALQFEKYISALAKIQDPMEADDDVLFRLGADFYILGTPALKVPRSCLLRLDDFESMKVAYPVWISYLLTKYSREGLTFDKVVIGLSMAFKDRTDELLTYLCETLGKQKEDGFFICLPQGLSCKLAYSECGLDIRESSKHNDYKMKNYLILDGGFLTCDICNVANGTASAGAAVGIPNTGLIVVSLNVIDYLRKEYNMEVSVKEAQTIVDNAGRFTRRGKEYNIGSKLDEFIKKYLLDVLNLLEAKFGEAIDAVDGILVCGGLSYFFKKYLTDPKFTKLVEDQHFPTSFLHFPSTDSEYFNAFSYLRIAQNILGNNKK